MASQAITNIKTAIGNGARSNKYEVFLSDNVTSDADLLCKSSSFPGKTIGEIEVWNQGRKYLIPGDTSYTNEWTVSFYNTEDHALRRQFIDWMKRIDNFKDNKHATNIDAVTTTMKVVQIKADGSPSNFAYEFHNVFPKDIGEITVEDETADAIQEFDVSFSFSHWEEVTN